MSEPLIDVYFRTAQNTLVAFFKRLQNQYDIISKDTDWNDFANNDNDGAKAQWESTWPNSMARDNVQLQQDAVDFDYVVCIRMVKSLADGLPEQDSPVFTCVKSTDEDFVHPTFKVEDKDEFGAPLGTYHDEGVRGMA